MSAKQLYDLLFSEEKTGAAANGGIWDQKTAASGSRSKIWPRNCIAGQSYLIFLLFFIDLSVGAWSDVDGKQQRLLKYVMPVSNPMGKSNHEIEHGSHRP